MELGASAVIVLLVALLKVGRQLPSPTSPSSTRKPKKSSRRAEQQGLVVSARVGAVVMVENDQWVRIENPHGISNRNTYFRRGVSCKITTGGRVRVKALNQRGALVEYLSMHNHRQICGRCCPTGAIFYLPTA